MVRRGLIDIVTWSRLEGSEAVSKHKELGRAFQEEGIVSTKCEGMEVGP